MFILPLQVTTLFMSGFTDSFSGFMLSAEHTDLVQQLTGNAASTEMQTLFSRF